MSPPESRPTLSRQFAGERFLLPNEQLTRSMLFFNEVFPLTVIKILIKIISTYLISNILSNILCKICRKITPKMEDNTIEESREINKLTCRKDKPLIRFGMARMSCF